MLHYGEGSVKSGVLSSTKGGAEKIQIIHTNSRWNGDF